MSTDGSIRPAPFALIVIAVAAAITASRGPRSTPPPLTPRDLPVKAAPVLSPAEAVSSFYLEPAFAAMPAANEPEVQAPVMAVFDEDSRLWVVEMRSYMPDVRATGESAPTNRISVLEDKDGDGVFETSTVFLDNLVLPRAVAPCYGGALVLEPPSLYFCKDTDGDGRADIKQKLLDGFGGIENPEHAANGLMRGIDNWHHFSQHNLEVRFDGQRLQTRPTPNHGQWGITQDDRGRLYYTPNSNPLLMDVFPKHIAGGGGAVAGMGDLIARDASTRPVRATLGVNRGYMPNVLRDDGTLANLTAACGPVIFRAGGMGPEFRGDAFICEPAGNLVKRLRITEKDGLPVATNAYPDREFWASTDERFRPVWALTGPDGCLYVCDMYRGVIQHKMFLTEYLEKHARARQLETPLNMGRIWRVAPVGHVPGPLPRLSVLGDDMLVKLLSHEDGWYRETAQRLLVERRAVGIAPDLRLLATRGEAAARLHALWTLEGLGLLTPDDIERAAADESAGVRAAALEIAAQSDQLSRSSQSRRAFDRLITDPDRSVRISAAAAVGRLAPDPIVGAVTVLTSGAGDKFIRSAALCSIRGEELQLLAAMLQTGAWPRSAGDRACLRELCQNILRGDRAKRHGLIEVAGALAQSGDPRASALVGLVAELGRLEGDTPRPLAIAAVPAAWLSAAHAGGPLAERMAACAEYLEWPGRPPARRPSRVRPLLAHEQTQFEHGREVYAKCASCHQENGRGSPGLAAALAGSKRVNGRPEALIKVLLHGMEGEYAFGDITYRGSMPPADLATDADVAAVLTYIRREWDNSGDPVPVDVVTRVRAETRGRKSPWTAAELDGVALPNQGANR